MSDDAQGPTLFDPLHPEDSADEVPDSQHRGETSESDRLADMRIRPPRITLDSLEIRDIADRPLGTPQQILFEEPIEEDLDVEAPSPTVDPDPELAKATARLRSHDHDAFEVAKPPVHPFLARLTSGLLDLAAMLAVALVALVGADLLGAIPNLRLLPGVLLFITAFSFLYHVISLLFWGRTPGMASVGLIARDLSGLPLTATQAVRRWLGSLGTVGLAGIPMLVSWFTGTSLADLLSRTEVLSEPSS